MKVFFEMIAASCLVLVGCGSCNDMNSNTKAIDTLCSSIFPEDQPGAAVFVMKGDKVLFDKGYGIADMKTGKKVNGSTFFNIASISKQFTAIAVLQCVEKGLLSLNDPVSKFFPEFESDIWDRVTISHLMSHSSGIPDIRSEIYTLEERIVMDDSKSVAYFRTLDRLNFEPGSEYEYINPTFTLLGFLIERVSGKPFADYMKENVFNPAGMEQTLYFTPDAVIPEMSHGYERDAVSGNWNECDYGEATAFATRPDGGIYTSTHEFALWEKALRNNSIVTEASRELAQSPKTIISGSTFSDYQNRPNTWYGYGWFIETDGQEADATPARIYHTGDNGGYTNIAARYPVNDGLIIIFSTRPDWDRYSTLQKIEQLAFGK